MASINPTSFHAARPYANPIQARFQAAKAAPVESTGAGPTDAVKPKDAGEALAKGRTAATLAAEEAGADRPNEDVAPTGSSAEGLGESGISEPVDLSGISARTTAVLEHTLGVLTGAAGIKDAATLEKVLAQIVGPLVAQDGVANPQAATAQYVQEMVEKAQSGGDTGAVGLKAASAAPGGLDLEG